MERKAGQSRWKIEYEYLKALRGKHFRPCMTKIKNKILSFRDKFILKIKFCKMDFQIPEF